MGLFDYVDCRYPLPKLPPEVPNDWQSKDTPAQFLDTYVITEDGRLLHRDYDVADHSKCALAGHDKETCTIHTAIEQFGGSMARVNKRDVEVTPPYDGDIYIHTFYGPVQSNGFRRDWIEYRLTFRDGRVTEVKKIEEVT